MISHYLGRITQHSRRRDQFRQNLHAEVIDAKICVRFQISCARQMIVTKNSECSLELQACVTSFLSQKCLHDVQSNVLVALCSHRGQLLFNRGSGSSPTSSICINSWADVFCRMLGCNSNVVAVWDGVASLLSDTRDVERNPQTNLRTRSSDVRGVPRETSKSAHALE
jgi:hypothetical protein